MDDAERVATQRKFRSVQTEGSRRVSRQIEHYNMRAVGRVLPGALTRIAAPGDERGPEPEGAWAASDASGAWVYFGSEDEACAYAAKLARQAGDAE